MKPKIHQPSLSIHPPSELTLNSFEWHHLLKSILTASLTAPPPSQPPNQGCGRGGGVCAGGHGGEDTGGGRRVEAQAQGVGVVAVAGQGG